MKAESKEKLLKKVKDWKFWVFGILPIVMIAAALVFALVQESNAKQGATDVTTLLVALGVITAAIVLSSVGMIFDLRKEKNKRNKILKIISIVLLLIFAGVECYVYATYLPKYYDSQVRVDELYEQYEAASESGDKELSDVLWREWRDEIDAKTELYLRFNEYHLINLVVCGMSSLVLTLFKKSDTDEKSEPTNGGNDGGNDGRQDVAADSIKL